MFAGFSRFLQIKHFTSFPETSNHIGLRITMKKAYKNKSLLAVLFSLLAIVLPVRAQEMQLKYYTQFNMLATDGDNAPYWFTANRQGLVPTSRSSQHVRCGLELGGTFKNSDFSYRCTGDIVVAHNNNADFFVQQLAGDISWRWLTLSIGSRERFSETRIHTGEFASTEISKSKVNSWFPNLYYNNLSMLSSGGMTYSGNCRPIPQVRLEIPEYLPFPGTNGWLKVRGHIAYGCTTDGRFQKNFTAGNDIMRYGNDILYHSKAGFIEIGKAEKFPLIFEGGLEMQSQFGGSIYTHGEGLKVAMPSTFTDYLKAFIPLSGSDATPEGEQSNISGNVLGSWHAAFTIPTKNVDVRLYGEHYFEDFSQLFFFEYQTDCNGKKNIIYYPWKDILVGIRLTNKSQELPFISAVQYEYITTKDQSGALYNDPNANFSEQMDGVDNYYNHGIYPGWHHWGTGIGNPLLISPAYNSNGNLKFRSNRLTAHNVGVNGTFGNTSPFAYRLQYTYSVNLGTYANPFDCKKYSTSLLGELIFAPGKRQWLGRLAVAYDKSDFIGNNLGVMFTLTRTGVIFSKK